MTTTTQHLEGALRHWENTCFILHTESVISRLSGHHQESILPEEGPLVHNYTLRKHLLALQNEPFNYSKYVGPKVIQDELEKYGNFLQWLPCSLAAWTRSSRRIFRVSADLAYLLMATSLKDIAWTDIPLPFDSFGISLEVPIIDKRGNKVDFILLSRETGYVAAEEVLSLRGLSPDYANVKSIGIQTRLRISEAIRKKRWGRPMELIAEALFPQRNSFSMVAYVNDLGLISDQHPGVEFKDGEETSTEPMEEHVEFDMMLRLVIGLCFYLKTLPPGSSHASDWVKGKNPTKDKTVVTNDAEICTVTSVYALKPEERTVLDEVVRSGKHTTTELRVHFRRGHWRRMPGCGDNPDAPRIVHVRPCIVRKDRLPPGAAPSGTIAEL